MPTATKPTNTTWHVVYTATMQRLVGEHVPSDDGSVKVRVTVDDRPHYDPQMVDESFTTYEAAHARALELWPDDYGHYGIAYLTIEKHVSSNTIPTPPVEVHTVSTWLI